MRPETQKVVEQLQAYRAQGLSYVAAVQKLQAAHASQLAIDDASNAYDYQTGAIRSAAANEPTPVKLAPGVTSDEYANTLIAVDQKVAQAEWQKKNRQRQYRPLGSNLGSFNGTGWVPVYIRSWWVIILLIVLSLAFLVYELKFNLH